MEEDAGTAKANIQDINDTLSVMRKGEDKMLMEALVEELEERRTWRRGSAEGWRRCSWSSRSAPGFRMRMRSEGPVWTSKREAEERYSPAVGGSPARSVTESFCVIAVTVKTFSNGPLIPPSPMTVAMECCDFRFTFLSDAIYEP